MKRMGIVKGALWQIGDQYLPLNNVTLQNILVTDFIFNCINWNWNEW